jgi:hypothetical protein
MLKAHPHRFLFGSAVLLAVAGQQLHAGETKGDPAGIPDWVFDVTRMAFVTPDQVAKAADAGVEVVHGNAVWPYFPLRRDGGGLPPAEEKVLRKFVSECHRRGMKLILGLPPFPSVELLKKHPDWRVDPDGSGASLKMPPDEKNLGTRLGCNNGPWGGYLIELCAELVRDYHIDGFSFDGNYHPPLCHCPACKSSYQQSAHRALPPRANLDDPAYRAYLVWRGERLEEHYRRLRTRLRQVNADAVIMSWSVNAGRYGHFLHSPRAMSTRLNRLFDLPMQEWWLDETNLGASVAPAFGAAYLRAVSGDGPNASEAYLMSRGNPYGTDSFPAHERLTRSLLAVTNGSIVAASFGWPGHEQSTRDVFNAVGKRARWLTRTRSLPWAALLVSEQTRQFYAYKDIAERFLPHVFGAFRAAVEEHLPLTLINDWDVTPEALARYAVVILPNAAALSASQCAALRTYVRAGGGLVATGETSLCDEIGRPQRDFALADLFGVSCNSAGSRAADYKKQRTAVATLSWSNHALLRDRRLQELVPDKRAVFRGPLLRVSQPDDADAVAVHMTPEGTKAALPAVVVRSYGKGKVIYLAACLDAGLWSYAYPYQRRLFARALAVAAAKPPPISVTAPMCVQAGFFVQSGKTGRRTIVHLFNGLNTTANHGKPAVDVPLREETVPIPGIQVSFIGDAPVSLHLEPGNRRVRVRRRGNVTLVEIPPLEIHAMLVAEY